MLTRKAWDEGVNEIQRTVHKFSMGRKVVVWVGDQGVISISFMS